MVGLLLAGGCGEGSSTDLEDDEDGHPPPAMVGVWTFQSGTENGAAVALANALEWDVATAAARLHIEANGTYYYEEVTSAGGQIWAEGGWVFVDVEGGTILAHIQWDSDGSAADELDMQYTLGSGVLTLEWVEGGSTFVFTLGT